MKHSVEGFVLQMKQNASPTHGFLWKGKRSVYSKCITCFSLRKMYFFCLLPKRTSQQLVGFRCKQPYNIVCLQFANENKYPTESSNMFFLTRATIIFKSQTNTNNRLRSCDGEELSLNRETQIMRHHVSHIFIFIIIIFPGTSSS